MDKHRDQLLKGALEAKKLNQAAYTEICRWLSEAEFSEFVPELTAKIDSGDWEFLLDAFYRVVIFGTGGIRGAMDIGTNRINNHTVRWASQAYADYLIKHRPELIPKGVAIAYDSRHHSQEFMRQTAQVLAANKIVVHIFKYYRATPELSFVVRHLGLGGGIVITASHNPPQYNGYKLYDEFGVQVMPDVGLLIDAEFTKVPRIKSMEFEAAKDQKLITIIDDEVDKAFAQSAKRVSILPGRDLKLVYSPLHGVGSQSVLPVLKELGYDQISVVEDQLSLDGSFPHVEGHFPNPELAVVYKQAISLAKKVDADLVMVSDPDADRLGLAAVNTAGEWEHLSGNQGAVAMGYFRLKSLHEAGKLGDNPVVIKTSVTSELVRDVAESFDTEVIGDLLVGFKFIGDRLQHLPADKRFIFACEESVGYLFSDAYRDKGAETAAVVAAEMGVWCKQQGITVWQMLESIYQKYGYYAERLYYREIDGYESFERMNQAMSKLRQNLPRDIGGHKVVKVLDRLSGEVRDGQTGQLLETRDWDLGDMISFFFTADERTAVHVRPSGTEAKMKYYTAVKGRLQDKTKPQIDAVAAEIESAIVKIFEDILTGIKITLA